MRFEASASEATAAATLAQESNGDVQAFLDLLASRYQVAASPLARLLGAPSAEASVPQHPPRSSGEGSRRA